VRVSLKSPRLFTGKPLVVEYNLTGSMCLPSAVCATQERIVGFAEEEEEWSRCSVHRYLVLLGVYLSEGDGRRGRRAHRLE